MRVECGVWRGEVVMALAAAAKANVGAAELTGLQATERIL